MTKRSRRSRIRNSLDRPLSSAAIRSQYKDLFKPLYKGLGYTSAEQAQAACQGLLEQPMILLDIEANGARHASEIVEIGMIDQQGKVLFHSLVRADRACTPHAYAVHHIAESALQKAPTFDLLWPEIRELLLSRPVLSFDIRSDMAFLAQTLAKKKILEEGLASLDLHCAMQLYRSYRESEQCIGLKQACQELGITRRQNHRVIEDCRLTLLMLNQIAQGAEIHREEEVPAMPAVAQALSV